jgi:CopG family nickel-responsive transcriptional regulator
MSGQVSGAFGGVEANPVADPEARGSANGEEDTMSELVRLSMSLEQPLFDRLEEMVGRTGYTNRSEYLRDLIRKNLVDEAWEQNDDALGTVTLLYDHEKRRLGERLTHEQHHHHDAILCTTHVHLDHHLCAETIMIRARAGDIQGIYDALRRQKGVLHAALSISTTGRKLR